MPDQAHLVSAPSGGPGGLSRSAVPAHGAGEARYGGGRTFPMADAFESSWPRSTADGAARHRRLRAPRLRRRGLGHRHRGPSFHEYKTTCRRRPGLWLAREYGASKSRAPITRRLSRRATLDGEGRIRGPFSRAQRKAPRTRSRSWAGSGHHVAPRIAWGATAAGSRLANILPLRGSYSRGERGPVVAGWRRVVSRLWIRARKRRRLRNDQRSSFCSVRRRRGRYRRTPRFPNSGSASVSATRVVIRPCTGSRTASASGPFVEKSSLSSSRPQTPLPKKS